MKFARLRNSKLKSLSWKIRKYISRSTVKVKCRKLQMTSSVIVTHIPIPLKSRQYQISSFWVARYHFYCCDLDLGPVTLKRKCGLDILTMFLHTKNEVARWSYSTVTDWKKTRKQLSRPKVEVKCQQHPDIASAYHGSYSYQITSNSDQ